MVGINRGRYAVYPGGAWQLYSAHVPPGWRVLGVIDRGGDVGALVEAPTGTLCQLNAGAVRDLDQRKARAALLAAGHA